MKSRLGIACGLLAVALTACGGDPEEPDVSATPTSATPSSSPTEDPSETFDPTQETAKQFIRRWIRLGNEMQVTGETDDYLAITTGDCRSCNEFADKIESIYEAGGWVETEGERVVSVTHDGKAQWSVVVDAAPTEYVAEDGGEVETLSGGRVRYVAYILQDDNAWVMTDYEQRAQ